MPQKYDIFISYRRKGGVKDARLVDEKLRNSGYSVSFDIDTLGRGKFTDTLKNRLTSCKDFIVIFEQSYYERFYDERGHVQPEEVLNEDWCYLELKNALQMNKNIIPLVHKDFVFPGNLPRDIRDVAEMNAIQLTEKEFKEIFEYKVKAYLISKPKFTHRYRKQIAAALTLSTLAVIACLAFFGLEYKNRAEESAARSAFIADSIQKAAEARTVFVADSIKKLGEAQTQSVLDSINKARNERRAEREGQPKESANQKTQLYWVSNREETGRILFDKLSKAGLKSVKCSGDGIKLTASKHSCKPNTVGVVKCAYTPQLTVATCSDSPIKVLTFGQTFNGSNKDEAASREKMLEDLQKANFSSWVSQLQALRK